MATDLSARVGDPDNAQRITVNLSGEVGDELRGIADRCGVSESSVVEIALRQLFLRVDRADARRIFARARRMPAPSPLVAGVSAQT